MKRIMKGKQHKEEFLDCVRTELDSSCGRLDGHTLSRLTRIRNEALEHDTGKIGRSLPGAFAGVTAAACVLVIMISLGLQNLNPGPVNDPVPNTAIEDLEILTAEESLEF
ncbi:MAG: hypothetical protein WD601_10785, partial [Pseudohongiellaceae bacterium]